MTKPNQSYVQQEVHTLDTEQNDDTTVKAEMKVTSERSVAKPRQRSVASTDGRFSCDECEATFTQSWLVGRHKKSKHEGEVDFSKTRNLNRQTGAV